MIISLLAIIVLLLFAIYGLLDRIVKRVLPNDEAAAIILSARLMDQIQSDNEALTPEQERIIKRRLKGFSLRDIN